METIFDFMLYFFPSYLLVLFLTFIHCKVFAEHKSKKWLFVPHLVLVSLYTFLSIFYLSTNKCSGEDCMIVVVLSIGWVILFGALLICQLITKIVFSIFKVCDWNKAKKVWLAALKVYLSLLVVSLVGSLLLWGVAFFNAYYR